MLMKNKVPAATFIFWLTKILTTGMGEDTSDFLVHKFGPAISIAVGFSALLYFLFLQLRADHYSPWIYWAAVVMVSVFGTMEADVAHVGAHIPYVISSAIFLVALLIIFYLWKRSEGTLSIDSITTRKRELFYWAVILATFALGTAAGDMTAHTFNWGFLNSGIIFGAIFLIPGLLYRFAGLNGVSAFWISYILTRPFGASFADWFGAEKVKGGLGYGFGRVALILTLFILLAVGYQSVTARSTTHD